MRNKVRIKKNNSFVHLLNVWKISWNHRGTKKNLKDWFCILFFVLRQRPRTSLQCFALYKLCSKSKHCRDVLGRCLRTKNKIENPSLTLGSKSVLLLKVTLLIHISHEMKWHTNVRKKKLLELLTKLDSRCFPLVPQGHY